MTVIEHTWRILHRTDLGHRHDSLIPEGAPIPEPDAELRVIEVVPAEQLRGAVEALKSIAFSDHEPVAVSASDLRTRAFVAWKTATGQDGKP